MIRLTERQIISMHSSLIAATGGMDGVRDNGLLESALEARFRPLVERTSILRWFKKRQDLAFRWLQTTRLLTETSSLAYTQCLFSLHLTALK